MNHPNHADSPGLLGAVAARDVPPAGKLRCMRLTVGRDARPQPRLTEHEAVEYLDNLAAASSEPGTAASRPLICKVPQTESAKLNAPAPRATSADSPSDSRTSSTSANAAAGGHTRSAAADGEDRARRRAGGERGPNPSNPRLVRFHTQGDLNCQRRHRSALEDILEEVVGEIYDEDDDGMVKKIWGQRIGMRMR